jgi:hypothetical protein
VDCPRCRAPIQDNAACCTACGMSSDAVSSGFKVASVPRELDHAEEEASAADVAFVERVRRDRAHAGRRRRFAAIGGLAVIVLASSVLLAPVAVRSLRAGGARSADVPPQRVEASRVQTATDEAPASQPPSHPRTQVALDAPAPTVQPNPRAKSRRSPNTSGVMNTARVTPSRGASSVNAPVWRVSAVTDSSSSRVRRHAVTEAP